MILLVALIILTHKKVLFPLLISNLCGKDMKHFVVEKPKDTNGRFASADLP